MKNICKTIDHEISRPRRNLADICARGISMRLWIIFYNLSGINNDTSKLQNSIRDSYENLFFKRNYEKYL